MNDCPNTRSSQFGRALGCARVVIFVSDESKPANEENARPSAAKSRRCNLSVKLRVREHAYRGVSRPTVASLHNLVIRFVLCIGGVRGSLVSLWGLGSR